MTLTNILVFALAALVIGRIGSPRWRNWLMLTGSVLAIYWLQSSTPIRHLDFWLPTASLALTILVWAATRPPVEEDGDGRPLQSALPALGVVGAVTLLIGLTRYVGPLCCLTPSIPPSVFAIETVLVVVVVVAAGFTRLSSRPWLWLALGVLLLALVLALKTGPVAEVVSAALRSLTGQSLERASALDLSWLGISYLAFRLLHVVLDRLNGRLPALSLQEFLIFVVFFPTLTAGPIDRAERIVKDLRQPFALAAPDAFEGGARIVLGLFKKFALADSLALFALSPANATQTGSTLWMWVLLYAYTFRLFFDFAGLSDIAIGLARLMGVHTPENFDSPYLKPNLTVFWNSWHMTLAQWFRAYFFNPVTRALRAGKWAIPVPLIIAVGQLGTMLLIGLWHGVTWNFVIWGAWHGVGLFAHNRWTALTRTPLRKLEENHPRLKAAYTVASVLFTFHFVALGWVWFALPGVPLSTGVFSTLLGM